MFPKLQFSYLICKMISVTDNLIDQNRKALAGNHLVHTRCQSNARATGLISSVDINRK